MSTRTSGQSHDKFIECFAAAGATTCPASARSRRIAPEHLVSMAAAQFDAYMRVAAPHDSLKPLSCSGYDEFGGLSSTAVDALR